MTLETRFLALAAPQGDPEQVFALSGTVMAWAEGVWLLDLEPFLSYWQSRAQVQAQGVAALWRQVLATQFAGDDPLQPRYAAALAGHPWRALLLLEAMRQGRHQGLAMEQGQRGASLLQRLNWSAWIAAAQGLAAPWKQARRKGFHPPAFREQLTRFHTSMLRLGIERPMASHRLNQPAVATRFGQAVALLWHWTLQPPLDLQGFPWQELQLQEPVSLRRTTDYPLKLWEQLEPLLLADLDHLNRQLAGRGVLVLELAWELLLEDENSLPLEVGFRSPHDLAAEAGSHKTLLTRLRKALAQGLSQRMEGRSRDAEAPWVTGWNLVLCRSLTVPDQVLDLFGIVQEQASQAEQWAALGNQLPQPLVQQHGIADWVPEASFGHETGFAGFAASLRPLAQGRPLFIFPQPQALEGEPVGPLEFLEEVSAKWWQASQGQSRRSYYKWRDAHGKALWLFQDENETWFVQGAYD